MAGIKEQLEAAGYDTSNLDEASILAQLDKAGYDTSSIAPAQKSVGGISEMLHQQLTNGLGPMGMVKDVQNIIQTGADKTGEVIAEGLAKDGIQMAPSTGAKPIKVGPTAAAAAGTLAQMTPDILMSTLPGESAAGSDIAKALTPGGRAAVGQEIGAAEKAAGIEQQIPTVGNFSKKLNLPPRERGFADILNKVKKTLDSGEKMDLQDLADFRDLVKQQYGAGKIAKGTKADAIAASTNKQATELLNKLIPARQKAAMSYAKIKKIQDGLKTLAKAGAGASGLGLAGVLVKSLFGK